MPQDMKELLAAQHTPARRAARSQEADRRLRLVRNIVGSISLRLQPYVFTGKEKVSKTAPYVCLPGTAIKVTVAEAVDVHDLMRDTLRLWRCWRPNRRRTARSIEQAEAAWLMLERSAEDLKPRD